MIELKDLLEKKGVTAYKMSKETNIAESTLSKIKYGKQKNLKLNTIMKMADYFEVDIDIIIKMLWRGNEKSKEIE